MITSAKHDPHTIHGEGQDQQLCGCVNDYINNQSMAVIIG